jgi:Flp pilus assembly protein TadG
MRPTHIADNKKVVSQERRKMMTVHKRAVRAAARLTTRFRDDTSGNVAIIFALVGVVMMLAIGAAVDVSRWLHARDQTVAAIDAATLAGGRALQTNSSDKSAAIAAAQKYYDENVTSRLPVIDDSVKFVVAPDGMGITASGTAYIKTPFLQFAAVDKLPLISTSQTEFGKSQISVGGNGGENIEVALMLDVTGSMCNNAPGQTQSPCKTGRKIDAMKEAAKKLIEVIVWPDQSKYTSKMAIVPFSDSVRLPTSAIAKAMGTPTKSIKKTVNNSWGGGSTDYYYNRTEPCVVERAGTNRYTDVAPGANNYAMPIRWDVGYNKRNNFADCTLGAESAILPLTSNKQALLDKVDDLTGKGGTAGQVGTAWAWYTLAPNWKSLWASASQPTAYNTAKTRKIAILMTDGEYNTEYSSEGIKTGSPGAGSAANGSSATQAKELCKAMKKPAVNIEIYTVGFEVGNNASANDVLTNCATEPGKYYDAKDEEELRQAFLDIALKLSSLYLSK